MLQEQPNSYLCDVIQRYMLPTVLEWAAFWLSWVPKEERISIPQKRVKKARYNHSLQLWHLGLLVADSVDIIILSI